MMNENAVAAKVSPATWIGLFLSLSAMVVIRQAFAFFVPEITFASAILKETLIWASAAALLLIIRRGERLPMRSIGLGTALVDVDFMGPRNRYCIGSSRRRLGLSHWLRPRLGRLCCQRTAQIVLLVIQVSTRVSTRGFLKSFQSR